MQDLSSIPDASAPTYQDPLYLEDQVPRRRPPIGEQAEGPRAVPRGMASACRLCLPRGVQLCECPTLPPGLPLLHAGYRAGDSDTEDECWSDTEAVPQPRPREKALSRSQSLRVIKRKPPVREVSEARGRRRPGLVSPGSSRCAVLSPTGHLTLPEGPDEEEDRALRRGQLGPTQPAQSYLVSCGALRAVQKGALAAPAPPGSALLAPAVG